MPSPDPYYRKKIGSLMNTNQFAKMQIMLQPLNESERMQVLYEQLKLEKEADEE